MSIPAFPKLFTVGHRSVAGIFDGPVEVTEKIDGSQFSFGIVNGVLQLRSKGATIHPETVDKLFKPVVDWVLGIQFLLPDGVVFHGETLRAPRHNVLAYDRTPTNHLALFGVRRVEEDRLYMYEDIKEWAEFLGCEAVPLLHEGMIESKEEVDALLDRQSVLGGQKIEGVVIKRYVDNFIAGQLFPLMGAKFVSEAFKEVHKQKTYGAKDGKCKRAALFEQYRTIPRFQKAVQHLREAGKLTDSPQDIGPLMKELNLDLIAECEDEIKEALWQIHRKEFLGIATKGFPQWYKEELSRQAFEDASNPNSSAA